jgi:sodium/potassium-transporting ATPase subunit alpha
MRVLGFARTVIPARPVSEYQADNAVLPLTNLDFIGMTGLTDPPKEGVPEAITKCREAGIRVFMVTGDHPFTGEAIARQVNLITLTTAQDVAEADNVSIDKVDILHDDRVQVCVCARLAVLQQHSLLLLHDSLSLHMILPRC